MDGIFNVLKPPGMTSHDVVGALRKILNMKKIGHGAPWILWLPGYCRCSPALPPGSWNMRPMRKKATGRN